MRKFSIWMYKNMLWIYMCAVICFAYHLFMAELPDHIYVRQGEKVTLSCSLPVGLEVTSEDPQEAMAQVPHTTYETVRKRTANVDQYQNIYSDTSITCYLFGVFPIKEIEVSVVDGQEVYASGRIIGIYEQTQGVLVLKTTEIDNREGISVSPAKNKVMSGDYITEINEIPIHTKEELVRQVAASGGDPLVLTLWRKGEEIKVSVNAVEASPGQYMLGIWVKDDMAGIGTLTYYGKEGAFGALGHGIGDGETGELLSVDSGSIYDMTLQGITKGRQGTPGELEGTIYYGRDCCLGTIHSNNSMGIYGTLDREDLMEYEQKDTCYDISFKQELTLGQAWILSDVSGEVRSYEIEITDIVYQPADSNKGIHFEVKDQDLIALTGGIVQGMSGSPIIQGGRLAGAVTHVLVNDPEKGYGVFIETMLER